MLSCIKLFLFFRQKIITTLPSFEINISDKKVLLLWKFLKNFPLPTSTSISMQGEDMVDAGMSASYTIVSCWWCYCWTVEIYQLFNRNHGKHLKWTCISFNLDKWPTFYPVTYFVAHRYRAEKSAALIFVSHMHWYII
jgi:hypothetical protein